MKKIVLLLMSALCVSGVFAKDKKKDPVVMTIAGKEIPLSEFIFIAKKDNSVNLEDKKSVKNYVELFTNYKLKVADAEAMGLHKSSKVESELNDYKAQLQESFLSDKVSEDSAVYVIYERTKHIPSFKHLLFRLPVKEHLVGKDTIATYKLAEIAYQRVKNGESFEAVGESALEADTTGMTIYETVDHIFPLQMFRPLEEKLYSMKEGEYSEPIRSMAGFHLFKIDRIIPNPGRVRVAHIITPFPGAKPTQAEIDSVRKVSEGIYEKAIKGRDFSELAKEYSADTANARRGGLWPSFGYGEMGVSLKPVENVAFNMKDTGEISKPIQTEHGFHILKLMNKQDSIPFEFMQSGIYETMRKTDRNFDLYHGFDEKMKARHGYVFYPEAYADLRALADDYFPTDSDFYNRGMKMDKTLIVLDTVDFPQYEFVHYMVRQPISAKNLSCDFMDEVFGLFVRNIVTEMERRSLEKDYPEFNLLVNEYYDGILLFELSNKRVWQYPLEEQDKMEAEWLKEIKEKYPVSINWKVLNKIKKYL